MLLGLRVGSSKKSVELRFLRMESDVSRGLLVVASRSPQPCSGSDYLDGKITRYGWFNKCYSDLELKLFCAASLGVNSDRFKQIGQKAFILHR